jgi:hypothetical protein
MEEDIEGAQLLLDCFRYLGEKTLGILTASARTWK